MKGVLLALVLGATGWRNLIVNRHLWHNWACALDLNGSVSPLWSVRERNRLCES